MTSSSHSADEILPPAETSSGGQPQVTLGERVARGVVWAQLGSIAEVVIGFLLSVFVIRQLGPTEYGVYGLLLGVVGVMSLFTRLGFEQVLGRYIPALMGRHQRGEAIYLFRVLLLSRLGISTLASVLMVLAAGLLGTVFHIANFASYVGALALLFVIWEVGELCASLFSARLQLQYVTLGRLLLQCTSLALTLALFVRYEPAVRYVLYATIAGWLVALSWYVICSREMLLGGRGMPISLKPAMRFGFGVSLVNSAQLGLGSQKDVLLLGILAGSPAEIGYYKTSLGLLSRLHGFMFSRWTVMTLPVLSEAYSQQGHRGLRLVWASYIKLMALISMPIFGFFAAFASPIVHVVLTDAYAESIHLLQLWSLVTIVTTVMGQGLSTLVLYAIGKERVALGFRVAAALVGVVLGVLLIPSLGALGAIVATGITIMATVVLETYFAARFIGDLRYPILFVGKLVVATLVACLPTIFLDISEAWMLILALVLFFSLFVVTLHFLKPLDAGDREAIGRISPRLAILADWF